MTADSVDRTEFAGQVAFVTGAAGIGIGQAVARRLAAGGASVVVTDRHERRTREVAAAMAVDFPETCVVGHALDVADRDAIDAVLDAVRDDIGPVRFLVNNAAINWPGPIWAYDVAHFDETIAVNLSGPWYLCRQVMPMMRDAGGGAIVNIGSLAADDGGRFGTEPVYAITKGALQTMATALAADGGPYRIRVNTVSTGIVAPTKFIDDHPDQYERGLAYTVLGEYPTPAEVAEAAAFLLSPRAAHITGTVLRM